MTLREAIEYELAMVSDKPDLFDSGAAAAYQFVLSILPDYEAAVDACEKVIHEIDTGSISFEDESLRRAASYVALARAALRRLREGVPA